MAAPRHGRRQRYVRRRVVRRGIMHTEARAARVRAASTEEGTGARDVSRDRSAAAGAIDDDTVDAHGRRSNRRHERRFVVRRRMRAR